MFRAFVEKEKKALTVDRPSLRKINVVDQEGTSIITDKPTWFRSDVFFYISAEGQMDTSEQMKKTFAAIEKDDNNQAAASEHTLISIEDLKKRMSMHPEEYTDDMIFVLDQYWSYLVEFGAFVKEIFQKIK